MAQAKNCFNCKKAKIWCERELLENGCPHSAGSAFKTNCKEWEHDESNDKTATAYAQAVGKE